MATISDMTECNDLILIKKGGIFTLRASYDFDLHPAYVHSSIHMYETED